MAENRAVPRRTVLAYAAASGAAACLGLRATGAGAETGLRPASVPPRLAPQARRTIMLDRVGVFEFAAHLGSKFSLEGSPEGVSELELFKAEGHGYRGLPGGEASGRREPFSLLFLGPEDVVLPQDTYTLTHPDLGTFALFLVPIGPGRQDPRVRYEAAFG